MKFLNFLKKFVNNFFGFTITVILVICIFYPIIFPVSRSNESVRKYVLHRTPIGTSMENVIKYTEKNLIWEISTKTNCGFVIGNTGQPFFPFDEDEFKDRIVGVKSLEVELGEYCWPFTTLVYAYFAFDENDELIEVCVDRYGSWL